MSGESLGSHPDRTFLPVRAAVALACAAAAVLASAAPASAGAPGGVTCDDRSVGVGTLLAPRQISGTYCRPSDGSATSAIVMVPGATYNRRYWDFPHAPATYSFARAAARAGHAAFAIDRLGTGESSRPLSAAVTVGRQARAVHEVIEHLRDEGFDGTTFEHVLLVGHSLGSGVSVVESGKYRDVDGVIVTGLMHGVNPAGAATILASLYPATLDPAFDDLGLDVGYLTTRPGTRQAAFHDPGDVEQAVIAADEATKDVVSLTELPDLAALTLLIDPYSSRIAAPVLLAVGSEDPAFCGPPPALNCSTPATILDHERPRYNTAPCVDAVVMAGAGHDINLHPSAPDLQDQVLAWADAVLAGACPEGT